jgi:alkylhydroperoxidase family enzyme
MGRARCSVRASARTLRRDAPCDGARQRRRSHLERPQAALIRLCDELHDTATISDALWEELCRHFTDDQRIELIYLVGLYHTVSFLTNGLKIDLEDFGERFPPRA